MCSFCSARFGDSAPPRLYEDGHKTWTSECQRRHLPRWAIAPLFYSQSTHLLFLRGRWYVGGARERPQTRVL